MRSQIRLSMHSWLDHPQHVWVQNRAHLHNAARWRQGLTLYVLPFCKLIFLWQACLFLGKKKYLSGHVIIIWIVETQVFLTGGIFFFNTLTKWRYLFSHFCYKENQTSFYIRLFLQTNRDMMILTESINSFIPVKGESVCHLSFATIRFITDKNLFDANKYI